MTTEPEPIRNFNQKIADLSEPVQQLIAQASSKSKYFLILSTFASFHWLLDDVTASEVIMLDLAVA